MDQLVDHYDRRLVSDQPPELVRARVCQTLVPFPELLECFFSSQMEEKVPGQALGPESLVVQVHPGGGVGVLPVEGDHSCAGSFCLGGLLPVVKVWMKGGCGHHQHSVGLSSAVPAVKLEDGRTGGGCTVFHPVHDHSEEVPG